MKRTWRRRRRRRMEKIAHSLLNPKAHFWSWPFMYNVTDPHCSFQALILNLPVHNGNSLLYICSSWLTCPNCFVFYTVPISAGEDKLFQMNPPTSNIQFRHTHTGIHTL